ncbi:MAG: orotate phosphoribosyltransferase [Candidatus Korarchaeota archaeon]|nr:orotate phosphoribosyltransferase [Candidatus Korarchaeota archaeon]
MESAELGLILVRRGMLKFGDFLLTSGRRSTIYVDLRPLPSFPEEFRAISEDLAGRMGKGGICGVAVGGLPLATAVALLTSKPLIYIRKERKEHGTMSKMEGVVSEREYVVIDDVATTGGSLRRAVEAVREAGAEVSEAWVVVDRLQGARESLKELGVGLRSIATLPDIVRSVLPILSPEERKYAETYLEEVGY